MIITNFKTDRYLNNFQEHLSGTLRRYFKISFPRENKAIKHDLVEFKVQCLKVFCYHGNKSTILLFIQFLEQLPKFLVNFTLFKYVKSQRSYGFLIPKELIFGFQILDLKDHFSASLTQRRRMEALKLKICKGPIIFSVRVGGGVDFEGGEQKKADLIKGESNY